MAAKRYVLEKLVIEVGKMRKFLITPKFEKRIIPEE